MAAEAAGKAYITSNTDLQRQLSAHSDAWLKLGEVADRQDALIRAVLP